MEIAHTLATFGVLALSAWELHATAASACPRRARPRASVERCPYCHEQVEDGTARVRCRGCGARHHAACWAEHQGCSVFACGSLEGRPLGGPAQGAAPVDVVEEPAAETPAEAPCPLPTAAPTDPVG